MSANSKIEWTDHTFNPWIGCTKVSPGCVNCYAESQDNRRGYTAEGWGKGKPRKRTSVANWREPLKWDSRAAKTRVIDGRPMIYAGSINTVGRPDLERVCICDASVRLQSRKPSDYREITPAEWNAAKPYRPRVFSASLADWLDDEVPIEWLADLLQLINETPNLDWLLLSKRPENFKRRLEAVYNVFGQDWIWHWANGFGCVPQNVWIGTTVENQDCADKRIPALLKVPAKVRFLSCEPMLGPVNLQRSVTMACPNGGGCYFSEYEGKRLISDSTEGGLLIECACSRLGGIHWAICGGESGPQARPMHPDWARSLRDQCQAAGVPFHFKQLGEWLPRTLGEMPDELLDDPKQRHFRLSIDGKNSQTEPCDCSNDVWMGCVGKKAAGRILDGSDWSEFPTPA